MLLRQAKTLLSSGMNMAIAGNPRARNIALGYQINVYFIPLMISIELE